MSDSEGEWVIVVEVSAGDDQWFAFRPVMLYESMTDVPKSIKNDAAARPTQIRLNRFKRNTELYKEYYEYLMKSKKEDWKVKK